MLLLIRSCLLLVLSVLAVATTHAQAPFHVVYPEPSGYITSSVVGGTSTIEVVVRQDNAALASVVVDAIDAPLFVDQNTWTFVQEDDGYVARGQVRFSPAIEGTTTPTIRLKGADHEVTVNIVGVAVGSIPRYRVSSQYVNAGTLDLVRREFKDTLVITNNTERSIDLDLKVKKSQFTTLTRLNGSTPSSVQIPALGSTSIVAVVKYKDVPAQSYNDTVWVTDGLIYNDQGDVNAYVIVNVNIDRSQSIGIETDTIKFGINKQTEIIDKYIKIFWDKNLGADTVTVRVEGSPHFKLDNPEDGILRRATEPMSSFDDVQVRCFPDGTQRRFESRLIVRAARIGGFAIEDTCVLILGESSLPLTSLTPDPDTVTFGPFTNGQFQGGFLLKNTGADSLVITNMFVRGGDAEKFELAVNLKFPFYLEYNTSLWYRVVDPDRSRLETDVVVMGHSVQETVEQELATIHLIFLDETMPSGIRVSLSSTDAKVGEVSTTTITCRDSLPSNAAYCIVGLQYNSTVLVPRTERMDATDPIVDGQRTSRFKLVTESHDPGTVLGNVEFDVALGNASQSALTATSFNWFDSNDELLDVTTTVTGSVVSVLGSNGYESNLQQGPLYLNVAPLPAVDVVRITYRRESIPATLALFNANGIRVVDLSNELSGDSGTIELNVTSLPSGLYLLRFAGDRYINVVNLIVE